MNILKLLKKHYTPIIVFGGVTGGCIYTNNWMPFFILCAVCFLVAIVTVVVLNLSNKKDINIYIVDDKAKYVQDKLFEEKRSDETVH